MAMLAMVNLRGVGESVKLNVGLTIVEITGLLLVILVGLWAFTGGGADVDFSRVVAFDTATDKNVFMAVTAATSLAFFAMVGFEDSVNMAEETKDPVKVFPKALLTGLSIAGIVYVIVAIVAVALVPVGTLEASDTPLVEVVKAGAPNLPIEDILPFISMFAVSNTALINMLMASRLIYGMARQHVLPPVLGSVHPTRRTPWVAIVFTTAIAFGLIFYVTAFANSSAISLLGGTTSLLLLAVFAMVNVAVLVLRRGVQEGGGHFKTPTALPVIGCLASLYLVTPLSGRPAQQYVLALILVGIGILLFLLTMAMNRQLGIRDAGITDPTHLGSVAGLAAQLPTDRGQLALCLLD
jgi:amino acid transporter